MNYSVDDDTLTVNAEAVNKIGINNGDDSYIKIYVPEDSEFVSLDYEGDVGDINVQNLSFDDVIIYTDVGNVTLTDITINGTEYDGMDVTESYVPQEGPQVNIETDCGGIILEY